MERIKMSVRQLVEFVLRGGDIDNRYGGMERAVQGSRIHRRLQKSAGAGYRAEVALSVEHHTPEYDFVVEGRADGVFTDNGVIVIDEIKTTAVPLESIDEYYNRVHWAQGMCYAYMLAVKENLAQAAVRLTYFHIETEEIKRFQRYFALEELADFFEELMEGYRQWGRMQAQWNICRNASIHALPFPFPAYRPGQRQMAARVYVTIRDADKCFCQAPTGIGKTISTLFPAVKAIGEGLAEKIFYLTAKTVTRLAAEDACARMRERGLRLKVITLTAKDKICFLEKRSCDPDDCPYAKGHFDRVNGALYELLQTGDILSREAVESCARKHAVCPYELSLDAALWSDCIICDYNYLFDPQVYLKRFFSGGPGEYVFLVDEAHNLVDRAREMYSAGLSKKALYEVRRTLGRKEKLYKRMGQLNSIFVSLRGECGEQRHLVRQEPLEEFNRELVHFTADCEEWLGLHPREPAADGVLEAYFSVLVYLRISELYDERYVTFVEAKGGEVTVRQLCLDPSALLASCMKRGRATALFSATLTPIEYFADVLGGDESSKKQVLPSPFEREHLCLLIADGISTRYKDREDSLIPVADMIAGTTGGKAGNYLAYFPSYTYMHKVYEVFRRRHPDIETLLQTGDMDEEARKEFLGRFESGGQRTLIGFCVLGGIYAEGIDLCGDRLIGAIIVGVGLPQIGTEQDILRAYYDRENGRGFDFAYRYPGMNKVLQAVGRVIRGEDDRGVAVLIDSRFSTSAYRMLFPAHWCGCERVRTPEELSGKVSAFWSRQSVQPPSE